MIVPKTGTASMSTTQIHSTYTTLIPTMMSHTMSCNTTGSSATTLREVTLAQTQIQALQH